MSSSGIAAVLAATIMAASMVSVEVGFSVALMELFLGGGVGNAFSLTVPDWLIVRLLKRALPH